jgi:predicted AlkP superfamily phosphohydrolase/phosphomutase
MNKMRVLVVGLDGANIDLIKQWVQEGKLPTFKKLLSEGTYGNLESVVPTITIPAWNCMASGKNSGKIGVFSFIQKEYGTYDFRVYQLLNKKEECVWDILSDNGKTVQVINAPNVLYSYKINGIMIAGAICLSDDKLTYPDALKGELEKIGYKRDLGDIQTLWSMSDSDLQTVHKGITDSQVKAWYHFMEQKWDFGFFVLTELDRVQHAFWNRKDVLLNHYQNIDKNLKELLTKIDNDTVLLFTSDHGFGPNKRTFLVNEWLKNRGLLVPKKVLAVDLWKNTLRIQKYPSMVSVLRFAWKKLAFMRPLYLKISKDATRSPVDFTKSKAFSSATWGTIYINLKGREPNGIVPPEEYENLRTEIINELKKVPAKAYRCEELYKGEYMKTAPDIVIQIDHYVNSCSATIGYGKEFRERFGGHHDKYNGTFIAWGPGIKKNHEVTGAHLYDIAPTILHMYGIPVKRDMDGKVLTDIFEGEMAGREVQYQEVPEKIRIRNKVRELKALGKI